MALTYTCGTLKYTGAGVALLFAWLLWGDVCVTLMETAQSVVPLKLKALGCPNWLLGLIVSTIPNFLNVTVCPWVSFKSDRYRGRWGRRIPFIVWTMPFLCASLILMGLSEDLTGVLHRHAEFLQQTAPSTITILLIAVFMTVFTFFNMFISSVFWYLFNDVVPPQFLGRLVALIRIVGTGAGALYNILVFQYSESHMREILIGAAVVYLLGFGLTCLKVKEGEYPPVEEKNHEKQSRMEGIKTFFRESFTHRFYWLVFLFTAFSGFSLGISVFYVFFQKEMGLDLSQIGYINGFNNIVTMIAMALAATYVDRWHPMRIMVYASVFSLIPCFTGGVWLFVTLPGEYFFWLSAGGIIIASFLNGLIAVAAFPRDMRMFPQSRFGQFCSAQSMLRAGSVMIAGILSGMFIDFFKWLYAGSDYSYRFYFIWTIIFTIAAIVVNLYAYRYWHRLGGDAHYHPPAPWSERGFEEKAVTTTTGPQTKWLRIAFRCYDVVMYGSVGIIVVALVALQRYGQDTAFRWSLYLVLPLTVAIAAYWSRLKVELLADMVRVSNGEEPREGIPHHGMLVVVGIKFLLMLGIWIAQLTISIRLNMQIGCIAFGVANAITNFLLVFSIRILSRVERGYSTRLDTNLAQAEEPAAEQTS